METLRIRRHDDPVLRKVCAPVPEVTPELRRLALAMLRTMRRNGGIGLAAPQVGELKRLFVIDVDWTKTKSSAGGRVFFNPTVVMQGERLYGEEGCLSAPGRFARVERFNEVRVNALDMYGRPFELHATDLLAVCIQHENDHLDGKVIFDD